VSAVYTFGQPRTGNSAWAEWAAPYLTAGGAALFRVVHDRDVVPRNPPYEARGYQHTTREVWYNEASDRYTVCSARNGEDPACSFSLDNPFEYSIDEHSVYLNWDMTIQCSPVAKATGAIGGPR
jgi:hypothetical protein